MADKKKTPAKKLSKSNMKKTKGGSFSFGAIGYGGASYKPQLPSNTINGITDGTSNTIQI